MGVLTLRLLVCGQLILFSLVVSNITNASQTGLSASKAPTVKVTGNHTANNALNSSSDSAYNDSTTTQNNMTTQTTPIGFNSTSQINTTVTGITEKPNSTENAQTTQSATSTTISINSTAATSTDNSTQSNNENATSSTTPATKTAITSITVTQNTSFNESQAGGGLNHSEKSMTILFSILLGVIVLVILLNFVYKYGRSKERSVQYTHRRLQNEDTGEPFAVSDDTLVISGGLYDGPQIYNPTMTVQNEEEGQTDTAGFTSRPTLFRLEFLREDQDQAIDNETSTFQTFHAHNQES